GGSVLWGKGDGTFQSPASYAVGAIPLDVAAADVTGDGKPDLVTANVGAATVSVLAGSGTGTFGAAQGYAVGPWPSDVIAADFNGDGKPDLAVANNVSAGTVSVLLNAGAGA